MMTPTMKSTLATLVAASIGAAAWLSPAAAQDAWRGIDLAPPPGEIAPADAAPPAPENLPEPDWTPARHQHRRRDDRRLPREQRAAAQPAATAWTAQNNADGSSALSVKQPLSPFWDARVGADINVAGPSTALSAADAAATRIRRRRTQSQSGGTAWAAMTAPGVGSIWDKTAIEARVDPGADQTKLGTSLSKSVPLAGNQYSLTLQNGYNVIQQGSLPVIGFNGRPTRSYETDQSAQAEHHRHRHQPHRRPDAGDHRRQMAAQDRRRAESCSAASTSPARSAKRCRAWPTRASPPASSTAGSRNVDFTSHDRNRRRKIGACRILAAMSVKIALR